MQNKISIYTLLLLLLLNGCNEEKLSNMQGSIQVVISDGSISKTLPSMTNEMTGKFNVTINNNADQKAAFIGTCSEINTNPQGLLLTPGQYTIKTSYGINPDLAFDAVYYIAPEQTINIEAGKTQTVNMKCTVGNALAAFELPNRTILEKVLKDYSIEIVSNNKRINWHPDDTTNPYFKAGNYVEFYLVGTWIETNDNTYRYKFATIQKAAAATKYKYTLSIDASNMNGTLLDIHTDETVEVITVNETVPPTWLPKPKLSGKGFDTANSLQYVETENDIAASIVCNAARPIDEIEITVDFKDPNLLKLNGIYNLSTLTPELRTQFAKANIVLPTIDNIATTNEILIHTGSLITMGAGEATPNAISVRAKANNRWSDITTYTITTLPPVFTISTKEERVWSKEFTIEKAVVTKGNPQAIEKKLVYQYRAENEGVWHNCNNNTRNIFNSIPNNKKYVLRAVYRDVIVSNIQNITLETPTQLPNSDMEEWHFVNAAKSVNTYNPWNTNGTSFWETNNNYTTRYRSGGLGSTGSEPYNCFPAVSYVYNDGSNGNSHKGNRAAELRNTAAGQWNTIFGSIHSEKDYNKVAGELFTGNITANEYDYKIDENGRGFNVRPTALKFWYKYAPLNNDSFSARIVLLDAQKQKIIEKKFTASGNTPTWTEGTVQLDYVDTQIYAKCAYIYVVFSSTTNPGANMPYNVINRGEYKLWEDNKLSGSNADSRTYIGSVLTIDDISLVYDK